jgi:hypothetical protein
LPARKSPRSKPGLQDFAITPPQTQYTFVGLPMWDSILTVRHMG